jgi:DNA-binding MarR family transcriptional regulator
MVGRHDWRARAARGTRARQDAAARRGSDSSDPGLHRLDRLVHERMRLGILSALAVTDTLTFANLKALLQTTDGNLSVHARRLEDAGYIACTKTFDDRIPKTAFRLTALGRRALEQYLDRMEALIRSTRER